MEVAVLCMVSHGNRFTIQQWLMITVSMVLTNRTPTIYKCCHNFYSISFTNTEVYTPIANRQAQQSDQHLHLSSTKPTNVLIPGVNGFPTDSQQTTSFYHTEERYTSADQMYCIIELFGTWSYSTPSRTKAFWEIIEKAGTPVLHILQFASMRLYSRRGTYSLIEAWVKKRDSMVTVHFASHPGTGTHSRVSTPRGENSAHFLQLEPITTNLHFFHSSRYPLLLNEQRQPHVTNE